MNLRVFKILKKTKVEGPGIRFCIWVQGCSKHCDGCYAKESWDKKGGYLVDIDELFEEIKNSKEIEGVTFLGGEPFEQAEALGEIAKEVKSAGLSIVCFTGNMIEDLYKDTGITTADDFVNMYAKLDTKYSKPGKVQRFFKWLDPYKDNANNFVD